MNIEIINNSAPRGVHAGEGRRDQLFVDTRRLRGARSRVVGMLAPLRLPVRVHGPGLRRALGARAGNFPRVTGVCSGVEQGDRADGLQHIHSHHHVQIGRVGRVLPRLSFVLSPFLPIGLKLDTAVVVYRYNCIPDFIW